MAKPEIAGRVDGPFDYIVVGGGTAGLVVASRLSEDSDVSVLVLEAGADHSDDPLVLTPGLAGSLCGSEQYDCNFISPPQATPNNRTVTQGKGRMLGGSSALNHMMTLYPSRSILDAWGALGNGGWSFDELAPYFRKFATTHDPPPSTRKVSRMDAYYDEALSRAESGPLGVSFSDGQSEANTAWIDTFDRLGFRMTSDPRHGTTTGAFQIGATIDPKTKTRTFAVSAYLGEEVRKRRNLTVLTETTVSRILFDQPASGSAVGDLLPRATGVLARAKTGEEWQIAARLEVVLAAGTLHTPQILELSGIGGRALLERHGIPVVVDNPNVGEHIQDHPVVTQCFEVHPGAPSLSLDAFRDPAAVGAALAQYQATREGPLGRTVSCCAFTPLVDAGGPLSAEAARAFCDEYLPLQQQGADKSSPDISSPSPAFATHAPGEKALLRSLLTAPGAPVMQYILFPAQVAVPPHPTSLADHTGFAAPGDYITVMTVLSHPLSRGSCHVVSADVADAPAWDPRYNAEPLDMEVLARGVRFVEMLAGTPPFAGEVISLERGARCMPDVRADSLEAARRVVRERQIAAYHVAGSCAMLPRESGGVVDVRLRVYGVAGLRVVDASVFPLEPLGNIQTTVYAVAERAADLIKEDRGLNRGAR